MVKEKKGKRKKEKGKLKKGILFTKIHLIPPQTRTRNYTHFFGSLRGAG